MTALTIEIVEEEEVLDCKGRPDTFPMPPCADCGGRVRRELSVDGFFKGRGHLRCRECRAERERADAEHKRAVRLASVHAVQRRIVCGVDVPITCACGCGASINQDTIHYLELREQGLTYREIAAVTGKNKYAVKQRMSTIPRYRRGCVGRDSRTWIDMPCHRCGRPVHTPANTQFPHCRGWCVPADEFFAKNEEAFLGKQQGSIERAIASRAAARTVYEPLRLARVLARRAERMEAIERRRAERRAEREMLAADTLERQRLVKLAESRAIRTGSREHWEQLGIVSDEIATLLDEQKRDQRINQIQYAPSIDRRFDGNDDGSWSAANTGAVAFDRDDDRWPYYAGQHRKRRTRSAES